MKTLTAALAMVLLAGCAGRAPDPVATASATDTNLTCAQIEQRLESNRYQITELGRERGAKVAQNVAAGVAGLFIWPAWFLMDFQGTAKIEQEALEQRISHLTDLYRDRGCTGDLR